MSTTSDLRIAIEQIASSDDPAANLVLVQKAVRRGAATGARIVLLPEATFVRFGADPTPHAQPLDGPWATAVRELAVELGVVVVVGMFTPAPGGRVHNTILVTGETIHEGYDKLHLYDGYGYREADVVVAGRHPLIVEVDGVVVGLATCYDVRFPELFRDLADRGAQVVLLPTHWGAGEGKLDAWQLLVRARALDATVWVVACDQADASTAGIAEAAGPRFGIGHSMVVSPLGQVLQELEESEGELVADLDVAAVSAARRTMPVLANRRYASGRIAEDR